jgi:hypothetical protein
MATLSVESVDVDGLDPTMNSCAAGGDEFVNDGQVWVEIDNQDASDTDVTFVTDKTVQDLAVADKVVTVPTTERRLIGPFSTDLFNDSDNKVQITYEKVTSLTIGLFRGV